MTAATSWLDLFDFKFEKYLTPWIVRLTWAVALAVSALWLAIVLFSVIWALAPSAGDSNLSQPSPGAEAELGQRDVESPDTAPPSSLPRSGRSAERPSAHWEFRPPELPSGLVLGIASAVTALLAIIVGVLWVRVILEMAIVVFNIATTLKDIDRKLTPGS